MECHKSLLSICLSLSFFFDRLSLHLPFSPPPLPSRSLTLLRPLYLIFRHLAHSPFPFLSLYTYQYFSSSASPLPFTSHYVMIFCFHRIYRVHCQTPRWLLHRPWCARLLRLNPGQQAQQSDRDLQLCREPRG